MRRQVLFAARWTRSARLSARGAAERRRPHARMPSGFVLVPSLHVCERQTPTLTALSAYCVCRSSSGLVTCSAGTRCMGTGQACHQTRQSWRTSAPKLLCPGPALVRVAGLLCSALPPLMLPDCVDVQLCTDLLLLNAGVVEIDPTYAWSMQVTCDINAPFIRLSCAFFSLCVLCMRSHRSM